MTRISLVVCIVLLLLVATSTQAFSSSSSPAFVGRPQQQRLTTTTAATKTTATSLRAVADIGSEEAFDKVLKDAGDKLVVVDYSTTWCGPCKVIAPKFDEFSDKYTNAVFLKVIGDATPEASKLMKREGVRSVPSFHYFIKGEKVEVVNGANAEAIEGAISKHMTA